MMGLLGYALAQGVKGAAGSAAQSLDNHMREQQQIAAEQRAANLQMDLQKRMAAAKEAMQARVDERFQAILKRKQGEGVPLEIAPGDPAPTDAADMTRTRTRPEAIQAALEEASLTDGAAYRAGRGMLDAELADERSDKKDKRMEKRDQDRYELEREKLEARERDADADRKSREGIAATRAASGGGSGGGRKSAQVQTLEFMRDQLGMSKEELKAFATRSKSKTDAQLFIEVKKLNKFATDEEIMDQVRALKAMDAKPEPAAAAPAAGAKTRLKYNVATGKLE